MTPVGLAAPLDALALHAASTRRHRRVERFWSRVDRASVDACWVWGGRRSTEGYGRLSWCGAEAQAHRIAYSLERGPIPAGAVVRHKCDNPSCCNPAHLELGTVADNNRDMHERGRAAVAHLVHIGVANARAKLTDALVRELRAAWRAGESIKSIARRAGLAIGTVHPMLHGKTWAHVAEELGVDVRRAGGAR